MAMKSSKKPGNLPEQDGPADKYEQYEDALFALLMDQAAESEGRRLMEENERLKQDPAAAVPEEARRRCLEAIDRAYRQREREEKRARRRAFARKACAWAGGAAAAILLTFTVALAASPSFRTGMYNLVVEVCEEFTSLRIKSGDELEELHPTAEDPVVFGGGKFALTCLPEDSHIISQNTTNTATTLFISGASDEDIVTINIYFITNPEITIDTEDADLVSDIEINGHPGLIVIKDSRVQIAWIDSVNSLHYSLTAFQYSEEDSISLAESIAYIR